MSLIDEKKQKIKKLFYSKQKNKQFSDFHLSKRVIEKFFHTYKKHLEKQFDILENKKRTKNVKILSDLLDNLSLDEIAIISITTAINYTADKGISGIKYNNLCQTISHRLDKEIKFKELKRNKKAYQEFQQELNFHNSISDEKVITDIISTKIINNYNIKSNLTEESKALIGSFLLHIIIKSTGAIKIRKESNKNSKSNNLKVCYLNQVIINEILHLIDLTFEQYNVNINNEYLTFDKHYEYNDYSFIKSNKPSNSTPKPYLNAINKLNKTEYKINSGLLDRILELREYFPKSGLFVNLKDIDLDVYRSQKFLNYVNTDKYDEVKRNKYFAKQIRQKYFANQPIKIKKEFLYHYRNENKTKAMILFDGAKEYYEALDLNKDYHVEYKKYAKSKINAINYNRKNKQKLFKEIFTLNKCNKLKDQSFHFIHECDFRGRVYTKNKRFSYQSNDLQRSLIQYNDSFEITSDNIDYLLLYMSNSYGIKGTIQERIKWTIKHKNEILNIGGKNVKEIQKNDIQFMEMAKEPFQFINCCIEYYNYINNKFYNSSIIIYSDGSCNAIQHTALITQNQELLLKTNLKNVDECYDFYSEFLEFLLDNLPQKFNNYKQYINRSLVKKPVMTYIYGASNFGISNRIAEDIFELCQSKQDFSGMGGCYIIANEITKLFFRYIKECFPVVEKLKRELSEIIKENDYNYSYINNLGFEIKNEYYESNIKEIKYNLDNEKIRVYYNTNKSNKIDKSKSLNSYNANYIHSKDAEHLVRTVNAFKHNQITTIHDSFGTSIDKVQELNKVLRKELYDMYDGFDDEILISPHSFT